MSPCLWPVFALSKVYSLCGGNAYQMRMFHFCYGQLARARHQALLAHGLLPDDGDLPSEAGSFPQPDLVASDELDDDPRQCVVSADTAELDQSTAKSDRLPAAQIGQIPEVQIHLRGACARLILPLRQRL